MKQKYTWQITPPDQWSVDDVCDAIIPPTEDILGLNKWVDAAEIQVDEKSVCLILTLTGHDRWWIRKRAPYLIASVATRAKIEQSLVKHLDVITPKNLKKARFRTEDGKRVFYPPDGSAPGPQLTIRGCKQCKDPRYYYHATGWRSGDEIKGKDLRRDVF